MPPEYPPSYYVEALRAINKHYPPHYRTVTTSNTQPVAPAPSERDIRRIVREEIADLLPIDVPDAPPEDL